MGRAVAMLAVLWLTSSYGNLAFSQPLESPGASDKLDLNSATAEQLKTRLGVTEGEALLIMGARPYDRPDDLVKEKILSTERYERIKDQVIAKPQKPTRK